MHEPRQRASISKPCPGVEVNIMSRLAVMLIATRCPGEALASTNHPRKSHVSKCCPGVDVYSMRRTGVMYISICYPRLNVSSMNHASGISFQRHAPVWK